MNISQKKQTPMIIEDVVIDGHWLIKELNRPAGPWVGQYLSKLRDRYQAGEFTSLTDLYIFILRD